MTIGIRAAQRRRATRWLLSAAGAVLIALVLLLPAARDASAYSQRGFTFSEARSFGSPGSGAGQLKSPAGVAVDQATGDVYVVDSGNNRVDEFGPEGQFLRAWGWGVKTGAKELQTCTTACQAGLGGHGKGELHGAGSIAIDNNPKSKSFGDVYVEAVKPYEEVVKGHEVEFEKGVIDKFTGEGAFVTSFKGFKEPKKEKGESTSTQEFESLHGIATDAEGDLWVHYNEEGIVEFNSEEKNKAIQVTEAEVEPGEGLAVGTHETLYIGAHEAEPPPSPTLISKWIIAEAKEAETPGEKETVELSTGIVPEDSTGIAVSPADQDALVDTGTSVAILTQAGELVQRVGKGVLRQGTGLAYSGSAKALLVADAETGRIDLFEEEPPGAPRIEHIAVSGTGATGTKLDVTIAPGGEQTEYWFRYGPAGSVPGASQPCTSPCVEAPLPHGAVSKEAAEYANVEAEPVAIGGLSPHTGYGFRAFAKNAHGEVESAEGRFATAGAPVPADGRQWEIVSPLNKEKNGAYIETATKEGGDIQASADGEAITYLASNAPDGAEGNRSPEPSQLLSWRTVEGGASRWSHTDLAPPNKEAKGIVTGAPMAYRMFSPDLSQALVDPYLGDEPKLSKDEIEPTFYLRTTFGCTPASEECYEPLLNEKDAKRVEFEYNKEKRTTELSSAFPVGANESLSAVVFEMPGPLTEEAANAFPEQNLYEWSAGTLKVVNVLSDGKTTLLKPKLGLQDKVHRNSISQDGSRVIFEAVEPKSGQTHLYERDLANGKTLEVDAPQGGTYTSPPQFQGADTSGNTIFFTDASKLTAGSTAATAKPDLYVCEVEEASEGPKCQLTDLSLDRNSGESANVQQAVSAIAPSGSEVFFVADGSLAGRAPTGSCKPSPEAREEGVELAAMCNLYVEQRTTNGTTAEWSPPKLIATLSESDEPDWAWGVSTLDLGDVTSRVSPNGEWFAFMSSRRLPTTGNPAGYDNVDAVSGKPDEEVYLYDSSTEALLCASCNATGAPPHGVHDIANSGEGYGLLADRAKIWNGSWLGANIPGWTHVKTTDAWIQSRYLLDNGRLFFNSPQELVPAAKNGKNDVYEYEPVGLGECRTSSATYSEAKSGCVSLISGGESNKESAFLDASESGEDVFFDTAAQLSPLDTDQDYDVYDATVCGTGGRPACVAPPPPTEEECAEIESCRHGGASNGSSGGGPAGTLTPAGNGNVTRHEVLGAKEEKKTTTTTPPKKPTRAQLYAKAVKACEKIKNKHKRSVCLAQAKKKYGAKKASKARKSSRGKGARR